MVWPVLGAVAGGLIASRSTARTNRSNAALSRATRKWNAKEDRKAERRHYVRTIRTERRAEKATIRAEGRSVARNIAAESRADRRSIAAEKRADQRQIEAEKRAYERLDPKNHRKRMEAAGFNPLAGAFGSATDIGPVSGVGPSSVSMGSSGFAAVGASSVSSHNTPAGFLAAENAGPAIGRIVAQGIEGVGEQILAADQLAIQRQEIDMERERLNLLARQMTMTPKIPGVYGDRNAKQYRTTGNDNGGNTAYNSASVGPVGGPEPIETVQFSAQEVKFPDGNTWIKSNPNAAEDAEASYGEIGAEIQGLATLGDDVYGNVTGAAFHPKWGWEFNWPRPKYRPKAMEQKAKTGSSLTRPLPPKKPSPYSGYKSSSSAARAWLDRLN